MKTRRETFYKDHPFWKMKDGATMSFTRVERFFLLEDYELVPYLHVVYKMIIFKLADHSYQVQILSRGGDVLDDAEITQKSALTMMNNWIHEYPLTVVRYNESPTDEEEIASSPRGDDEYRAKKQTF